MEYTGSCGYNFAQYSPSFFHYRPGPLPAYKDEQNGLGEGYQGNNNQKYVGSVDDLANDASQMLVLSDKMQDKSSKFSKAYSLLYLSNAKQEYFVLEPFLTHEQPTEFVDDAKIVEEHCKNAFKQTTGKELPKNISIHLCTESELKKAHSQNAGIWNNNIQGFSINKNAKSVSEVFVKKDLLDKVMITLGHEIGHVISPTLPDARDEEAKAFAFSVAWMQTIVDNNIAGLTNAINPLPAKNGLHDAGWEFVQEQMSSKKSAFNIFMQLSEGLLSITKRLEQIIIT